VALGTVAAGVLGVPVAAVAFLGGLVAVVGLERSRGRRRAAVLRTREQVDEALAVLGAELVAGRAPPAALASAAAAAPAVAPAAQLAALGGDPTPALQQAAGAAGAEALHGLAAAYGVASRTGAALSPVVQRLRLGLAGQAAGSREAAEQLAPVHATARVLAVLPLLGLGLGGALGVDTPALLTGTTWGQVCLLLALGLVAAGLWWVDALARRTLR
jgi:tight adherence protein B